MGVDISNPGTIIRHYIVAIGNYSSKLYVILYDISWIKYGQMSKLGIRVAAHALSSSL